VTSVALRTPDELVALVAFAVWFGFVYLLVRAARRAYAWLVAAAITFGRTDAG
jgi:hypothetical protein